MNILNIVPEPLPTFRADVVALFGQYLPELGVHSVLLGMPGKGQPEPYAFKDVQVSPACSSRLLRELAYVICCLRKLFILPTDEFDVVQVRDMVPVGFLGLLAARLHGKRFVYWMSYLMSEGRIERAHAKIAAGLPFVSRCREYLVLLKGLVEQYLLYRWLLPRADFIFVQSEAMLAHVARKGIVSARMSAVPMGVDMKRLAALDIAPRRLPGWENVPIIAYLGTLDRLRRLDEVIDALVLVREQYPMARLLLIGASQNPADVASLLAHAAERGLANAVHVTGWRAAEEAWPLLAGADVAVSYFPRGDLLDTNSPTKIIEYLALGIPCVGNDNPDQSVVLRASAAGVLTGSSVIDLAAGLCAVLSDPVAARTRASAGPAYVLAERSYQVLAERVACQYKNLEKRA